MKAIVIGAGEVGVNVAHTLSVDGHDVTLVDRDPDRCAAVQSELDALVVEGNGGSPHVLSELDAGGAELLAATTNNDEANIIAALGARQLGTRTTVARVRDPDFFGPDDSFARDVLGIDFVIDPDRATARDVAEALALPGAVSVEYFGDGRLALAEVIVGESSPLIGSELARRERPHPAFIVGLSRAGVERLTRPDMVPEAGDHLLVAVPTEHVHPAVGHLAGSTREVRDCLIFGGGRIGFQLARLLERTKISVRMLERDATRARYLAERLPKVTVMHDEGISAEALAAANVADAGAFVACAGDDRANLLAALNAKRLGADLCMSIVSREEFSPLVDALAIDASFSPRLIAAEGILRFVHTETVRAIHLLRSGFEVIEFEAEAGARIAGKEIGDTDGMLRGCRVGALLREGEPIIPQRGTKIVPGDRVLMLGVAGALSGVEPFFTCAD